MSTLTPALATALNSAAATPGVSGMPSNVTFASSVSRATPEIRTSSMSSSTSCTQVPGASSSKEDRTCSRSPLLRASSTERDWSTFAPAAASSSMSS